MSGSVTSYLPLRYIHSIDAHNSIVKRVCFCASYHLQVCSMVSVLCRSLWLCISGVWPIPFWVLMVQQHNIPTPHVSYRVQLSRLHSHPPSVHTFYLTLLIFMSSGLTPSDNRDSYFWAATTLVNEVYEASGGFIPFVETSNTS